MHSPSWNQTYPGYITWLVWVKIKGRFLYSIFNHDIIGIRDSALIDDVNAKINYENILERSDIREKGNM